MWLEKHNFPNALSYQSRVLLTSTAKQRTNVVLPNSQKQMYKKGCVKNRDWSFASSKNTSADDEINQVLI
jgi:hypothetical protein